MVWLAYIAVSGWGVANLKIDYKSTYFIGETAYVRDYFDKSEIYFQNGETASIITDTTLDISTVAN